MAALLGLQHQQQPDQGPSLGESILTRIWIRSTMAGSGSESNAVSPVFTLKNDESFHALENQITTLICETESSFPPLYLPPLFLHTEEVLRPEILAPLLRDPGSLERLSEHLPPEHRCERDLTQVRSHDG